MSPSPIRLPTPTPASGEEGTPSSQILVILTKQECIQLQWEARYWKREHGRAVAREAVLKQELEQANARIRDLEQRLYGKRSEKVFEEIPDKVGYRWYLWQTRSASVIFFWMAPGRAAEVLQQHFAALNPAVWIILVCDRYSAYPCWVKGYPKVLLLCAPRDRFIDWSQGQRQQNLHRVVNNARFLILPWVDSKKTRIQNPGVSSQKTAGGLASLLWLSPATVGDLCRKRPLHRRLLPSSQLALCWLGPRAWQARPFRKAERSDQGYMAIPLGKTL